MELKINNQTKQFRPDSLTVQALLDLEIPQTKRNSHCDQQYHYPKTKLAFTSTKQMIFSSSLQPKEVSQAGGLFVTSPQVKLKT
jgi:hypothetical protein